MPRQPTGRNWRRRRFRPPPVSGTHHRGDIMTDTVPTATTTNMTRGFRWSEVPPDRGSGANLLARRVAPAPGLGAIADFTGTFSGNGFNTIFRPQNFAASPTPLPN